MADVTISSIQDLVAFSNGDYGRCSSGSPISVVLTADLDFNDLNEYDSPYNWAGCTGTWYVNFDGQGHKIDNIYYSGAAAWGFFGTLYGSVKNLKLTNMYVTSATSVCCGLMCFLYGTAENCQISGYIAALNNADSTPACGICFQRGGGSVIQACSVSGTIRGTASALGICQNSSNTSYTVNCLVRADIEGGTTNALPLTSERTICNNCIFIGTVKAGSNSYVGGYNTQFNNCIFVYKAGSSTNFRSVAVVFYNCYYDDTVAQAAGFSLASWLNAATTEEIQSTQWLHDHDFAR